jgi:multicomponent Na+:H+ antiporter subunit E
MGQPTAQATKQAAPLLLRAAAYFVFWIILAGTAPKDILVGVFIALIASWMSLQLIPAGEMRPRPVKALALFVRFLWQSVVAGVTVARIALSPVMALRPGMVAYRSRLSPGNRRFLFMTYASLLPGTLPTGTDDSDLISVHALDTAQPVAQQLADEEQRLAAAITEGGTP